MIDKNRNNEFTAEETVKEFSLLSEIFPAAVLLLDADLKIISVNELALSLTGLGKAKLINESFINMVADDEKEKIGNIFQKINETAETQTVEVKIKKRGNNYFHSMAMIKSFYSAELKSKLCSIALVDITFQKMKEEVIRNSEARFENMANTAPVMIWIADVEGLFSFVNKVWLDYSGKSLGDNLGMNWLKDVFPDDQEKLIEKYQYALKIRKPFTIEFRLKGGDGNYEWMMINGTPRFSNDNIFLGFIGSCTSIKAQKEYEEKLNNINAELLEINASKDKFFSIISHDLRSPLSGLMGILDILSTSYDTLSEDEKLEIINEAANTSRGTYTLVQNLLEWSRIQTGKMSIEPEEIRLLPLIHNLEKLYSQNLKNKKIIFVINVHPGTAAFADLKMTETVLRNLISNAIKFTRTGGTIAVMAESRDGSVIIKIVDNGVGIDEKRLDNLFKMDVGYSTKGTEKESGTGLGLIICKDFVERQKGKIWVESKKDKGTTFYISLPVQG